MKQTYTDRTNGKTWIVEQNDCSVLTSSGGGKSKEKVLASPREAQLHARKEAWNRLKKGFVLFEPQAAPGEAAMHRYEGGAYTGFMPVAPVAGSDSFYSATTEKSGAATIGLIGDNADKGRIYELPEDSMLFAMRHAPELGALLLNLDHQIVGLDLDSGEMTPYTPEAGIPASVLSHSGTSALLYDGSRLIVRDLADGRERLSIPVRPEQYGGHTPQLSGALARSGGRLAYSAASEDIVLVDLTSGERRTLAKPVKTLTAELSFSPDGRYLFALDEYAHWGLRCYDLNAMKLCRDRTVDGARRFALHERKGLLAVCRKTDIALIDLASGETRLEFEIEHIVKNAEIAFTDAYLAVHTDYGCVSLYALPR